MSDEDVSKMLEAADLRPHALDAACAAARAQRAESARKLAVLAAGTAIAELRSLLPQGQEVLFEGPQEPGGGATVLLVRGPGSTVLFDLHGGTDPHEVEGHLTLVEDYLTEALECGAAFLPAGVGLYRLPLRPVSEEEQR